MDFSWVPWEIFMGFFVVGLVVIGTFLQDKAEQRRQRVREHTEYTNWEMLSTELGKLERLIVGEHGLEEDVWTKSMVNSLTDCKSTLELLRPRNGVIRKTRGRSGKRRGTEIIEQSA